MDEQQVYNNYDSSLIITVMIQPMIIITYEKTVLIDDSMVADLL